MQASLEPMACGSRTTHAHALLQGVASGPSVDSPNLVDTGVSALVHPVYVGVDGELAHSAQDQESVSVISVSLLEELREQQNLHVLEIGMIAAHNTQEGNDDGEDVRAHASPYSSRVVNATEGQIQSDEVAREECAKNTLQANLEAMGAWRDQRSGSSALVLSPPGMDLTLQEPINGAELARSCTEYTLHDGNQVLLANPKDGSYHYRVTPDCFGTDDAVNYEFISMEAAINAGFQERPNMASDLAHLSHPIASRRPGKRPMGDDVDQLPREQPDKETNEDQLANALGLQNHKTTTIPEKRQVIYPTELLINEHDSGSILRYKKAKRSDIRTEVQGHNDMVDRDIYLEKCRDFNMRFDFDQYWNDYRRSTGYNPPTEAVAYWVLAFPDLEEVLRARPYFYNFDGVTLEQIKEFGSSVDDDTNSADPIDSVIAAAILKLKETEDHYGDESWEPGTIQTLRSIIGVYSNGQEERREFLKAVKSANAGHLGAVKQTGFDADNSRIVEVLKSLDATIEKASKSAGLRETKTHIKQIHGVGTDNEETPDIKELNHLCEMYHQQTNTTATLDKLSQDWEAKYALYKQRLVETQVTNG